MIKVGARVIKVRGKRAYCTLLDTSCHVAPTLQVATQASSMCTFPLWPTLYWFFLWMPIHCTLATLLCRFAWTTEQADNILYFQTVWTPLHTTTTTTKQNKELCVYWFVVFGHCKQWFRYFFNLFVYTMFVLRVHMYTHLTTDTIRTAHATGHNFVHILLQLASNPGFSFQFLSLSFRKFLHD